MIKKYLIIFLLLFFIYNNTYLISNYNNFSNTDYEKYLENLNTTVSIEKPTLTLYYDRYDKYSKYFYDDTKTVHLINIQKINDNINEINDSKDYFKEMFEQYANNTDLENQNTANQNTVNEIPKEEIILVINNAENYLNNKEDLINSLKKSKYNFTFILDDLSKLVIETEINEISLENINDKLKQRYITDVEDLNLKLEKELNKEIESKELDVWNQLKLIYSSGGFPFLNEEMITLEEVYCQDGKMPFCVNNDSIKYKIDENYYQKLIAPSPSEFHSPKFDDFEMKMYRKSINQFPRDKDLVDKLPKIIFTYQKYEKDGLINNKNTYVVEYDGIYNVNNEFVKLGRNNILKFVQDTMIEKLESKGPNPLCDHDGYSVNIKANLNLDSDIKNNPDLNMNINQISKCSKCSEFEITYH